MLFVFSVFIVVLNGRELLENGFEIYICCFSFVLKDFILFFDEINLILALGVNLINYFFDLLFYGFFGVLYPVFFQIMIIVIINTFLTKEFSVLHAKVFQFSSIMGLAREQLSFYGRFGFICDLVVICLKLVVRIQHFKIKFTRCLAFLARM